MLRKSFTITSPKNGNKTTFTLKTPQQLERQARKAEPPVGGYNPAQVAKAGTDPMAYHGAANPDMNYDGGLDTYGLPQPTQVTTVSTTQAPTA